MFKLFVIGEIIGLTGAIIALVFGQEWGLYVIIGGVLMALPSIFEPKPKKIEEEE
jgi:hypothetical protein